MIKEFEVVLPDIDEKTFIAEGGIVIGKVIMEILHGVGGEGH